MQTRQFANLKKRAERQATTRGKDSRPLSFRLYDQRSKLDMTEAVENLPVVKSSGSQRLSGDEPEIQIKTKTAR
jgi:hypothetical protein